jgi:hypothetical protein
METVNGHCHGAPAQPASRHDGGVAQHAPHGSRAGRRLRQGAAILLALLALPACLAQHSKLDKLADGPAMKLRNGGDEAAGAGAPQIFDPETMRVVGEGETITLG